MILNHSCISKVSINYAEVNRWISFTHRKSIIVKVQFQKRLQPEQSPLLDFVF